jgi:hypothetical protein
MLEMSETTTPALVPQTYMQCQAHDCQVDAEFACMLCAGEFCAHHAAPVVAWQEFLCATAPCQTTARCARALPDARHVYTLRTR